MGNLLSLRHATDAAGTGAYTRRYTPADGSNQLATLTVGALTADYTYDRSGNLTAETTSRLLEWDHANRLATFRIQAGTAEPSAYTQYRYDLASRRVVKVLRRQNGPTSVTVYVGAGFERVLRTITTAGATTTTTHDTLHVLDVANRVATLRRGDPLPDDPMPPTVYTLSDHLSSSTAVTDPHGVVLNREEYAPYGETTFGSHLHKRYRFTAKERDEESALSYHDARYYAPWLARWTACDPSGHVDSSSLYAYSRNSPLRYVDPSGRYAEAGHYYTVYFLSLAAGFSPATAYRNAAFAQMPDEAHQLDAFSQQVDTLASCLSLAGGSPSMAQVQAYADTVDRRNLVQQRIHALTGGSSASEQAKTRDALLKATPGTVEFGLLLHRFGDSYAHSEMKNEGKLYGTGFGHAKHSTNPDRISSRPELYATYVEHLFDTLSAVAAKENLRPRLDIAKVREFAATVASAQRLEFAFPESSYPLRILTDEKAQIPLIRELADEMLGACGALQPYAPEVEDVVPFQQHVTRHPDFMTDGQQPLTLSGVDSVIPVFPPR